MRLTALTFIGALGIGALGLAAAAAPASAAPFVPGRDAGASSNIVQVRGGCGPGARPVPGYWSRGGWVPQRCVANYYRPNYYRPYSYYRPYYRPYSYYRPYYRPYYAGWRGYGYGYRRW